MQCTTKVQTFRVLAEADATKLCNVLLYLLNQLLSFLIACASSIFFARDFTSTREMYLEFR